MRSLAVAVAALAIACAGDSTSPSGASPNANATVSGVWNLQTMNGAVLPASRVDGEVTVTMISAVLTMTGTNSGSYREDMTYRLAAEGSSVTMSQTAFGTWAASAGVITFHDQTSSDTYRGSVSGGNITEVRTAATMVYSR